ncbi:ABC transporter substrate-binding protein [Cohnella sp.]|uniref:ABC transporter substrate-binding protein n=1 Tax=Cohnella sp. TaxID=1883426 RepID=UPI003565D0A6
MKKYLVTLLSLMLVLGLLSACGGGGKKEGELAPLGKDEEAKIKVMFWDSNYFFQEYGNMFATQFPNVEIEVANMQSMYSQDATETMEERFNKFLDEHKPDVLLLQGGEYEKLAQDGKLFALDSVIEQDKFETEGIHPAILKMLREQGGGKLYGLSPEFSSSALFYNVDLFKKHGVEPPKDSMSWEEVFELAKRFPTDGDKDSKVYGLSMDSYSSLSNLIQMIGSGQELRMLSADGSSFNIETDSWRKVFQSAIDAAKSGALYVPTEEDRSFNFTTMEEMYQRNLFVMGRSAMAVKSSYEVQQIIQAKEQLKNVTPVNWGIVTAPVDPNNRNQSSYFSLGSIFAVSSSSANPRAAWEFIKYINGDPFAKLKSKSLYGSLLSRTKHNPDKDGRSMEPFYKLEPKANTNNEYTKAPINFFGALSALVEAEVDAALNDKKTVEEALEAIQEKGEAELLKARKAAEEASPSPSASSASSESESPSPSQ